MSMYEQSNMNEEFNTSAIRQLLREAFDDEELITLCYDEFRPVYERFTSGVPRLIKIQLLIDYCERYGQFDQLLAIIKALNSHQYSKYISSIREQLSPSPTLSLASDIRSTLEIKLNGDFGNMTPEQLNAVVGAFAGALAGVLKIPFEAIEVAEIKVGSLTLKIEIPEEVVKELIAKFQEGDPLVQELDFDRLKLQTLEDALSPIEVEKGKKMTEAIRPIIYTNLARGRIQQYLDEQQNVNLTDYVRIVAHKYEHLHSYLIKVQVEKDPEIWEELFQKLQRWAYEFLRSKQEVVGRNIIQDAIDCAANASSTILVAQFPFDIDFERWAVLLVQNACEKLIAQKQQPVSIPDKKLLGLEDWKELVNDSTVDEPHLSELRLRLLNVLKQLPEKRQQFLSLYYFEQRSMVEIAQTMNLSLSALYKLHFDALRQFRKILEAETHQQAF